MDALSDAIAAFDGGAYDELEHAVGNDTPTADVLDGLIVLLEVGDERAQIAASWALWRLTTEGCSLLPAGRRRVVAVLERPEAPVEARLHLAHAVPFLRIPPDAAERTCAVLERFAGDQDRELRLVALDALAALAKRFAPLRERVAGIADAATHDKTLSVRARARNVQRALT